MNYIHTMVNADAQHKQRGRHEKDGVLEGVASTTASDRFERDPLHHNASQTFRVGLTRLL